MKYIVAEPPRVQVKVKRTRLVGWIAFSLLVAIAAAVGAAGGVLLVYTTDLPEVTELEKYRPSSITEPYDDQGKVDRLVCPATPGGRQLQRFSGFSATRSSPRKTRI